MLCAKQREDVLEALLEDNIRELSGPPLSGELQRSRPGLRQTDPQTQPAGQLTLDPSDYSVADRLARPAACHPVRELHPQ